MYNNKYLINNAYNRLDDLLHQLSVLSTLTDHFNMDNIHERSAYAHIQDAEQWLSIAFAELRSRLLSKE